MGAISSKKAPPHLATIPYPPYGVQTIGQCHLLVAGGGGAAKTGVKNRIDIYQVFALIIESTYWQIELTSEDHASTSLPIRLAHVASIDTGAGATMHFSFDDANCIAAGQDASTFIYTFDYIIYTSWVFRLLPNVIYNNGDELLSHPTADDKETLEAQRKVSFEITANKLEKSSRTSNKQELSN